VLRNPDDVARTMSNVVEHILAENNDFEGAKHFVEIEGLSDPKVCNGVFVFQ
jgi:hypothetical protein